MTDTKTIDPKGLIPDAKWRELMGGISQSTEKRNEKTDPDYPPTITRGNRNFKRVGDAYAYLDKLAERAGEQAQDRPWHLRSQQGGGQGGARRRAVTGTRKKITPRGAVLARMKMPVIGPTTGASSGNKL